VGVIEAGAAQNATGSAALNSKPENDRVSFQVSFQDRVENIGRKLIPVESDDSGAAQPGR
jgi:hypothetical protein